MSSNSNDRKVFGPCSEKQRVILSDFQTDVMLTGGGAGSGKSFMCLIKNLKHIKDPNFRCAIFRQTTPQLKNPGSLIDESKNIYPLFGGVYKTQAMKWVFPSGAEIQFAAFDNDKMMEGWKGAQLTHILVDEAADWPLHRILFLLSRLRSAKFKGKLQAVLTCNPDRDSFLFDWVEWCLDEHGVPLPGTENVVKYFVNIDGKVRWGSSPEELYEAWGAGKTMGKDFIPLSFRFIPATVYDNTVLLKTNPGYLANLLAMNRVEQMRFLKGSWTARLETEGYFKREWLQVVTLPCVNPVSRVRAWDLGHSPEPGSEGATLHNPDYTAGVLMSRDKHGIYYIEDVVRFRKRTHEAIEQMIQIAHQDGVESTTVTVPKETGAGLSLFQHITRALSEAGVTSKGIQVSGHSSKLSRFLPFASLAESGNVRLVKGPWNEDFLLELEQFQGGERSKKDDQVDATSDAFNFMAKQLRIPVFTPPDLSRSDNTPKL